MAAGFIPCLRFPLLILVLLLLLLTSSFSSQQPAGGTGDRDALLAVKKDWELKSWEPAAVPNHCSWTGVTCDVAGGVTALALPRMNLAGSVPASVCALRNLTRLDLSYNNLTGAFPYATLYTCTELRFLDLSNNYLSGSLPRDIDGLSAAMEHLNLSTNSFTGQIPHAVARFPALKSLGLYNNRFSGDFPAKILSSPKLSILRIYNNGFTGTFSSEISSSISRIELGNNMFSGSFPTSAPGLKVFHAENNRLGGELPSDMSKLPNLTELSAPGNRITGSIPTSIKLLRKLHTIDLSGNRISGVIPPGSIGLLLELTTLDLSDNLLTGSIPSDINNLPIKKLNLSSNQLTGEVPEQLQSAAYGKSFLDNPGLCARAGSGMTDLPTCRGGGASRRGKRLTILLAKPGGAIVVIGMIAFFFFLWRKKRASRSKLMADWKMTVFTQLNFTALDVLHNIRKRAKIIGSGGSGKVYRIHVGRNMLGRGGRTVAVKNIENPGKGDDEQLDKQFDAEVKVLGSIQHRNIVELLCCLSGQEAKLLVYEYMENGSLDRWLHHRKSEEPPLDWPTRLDIAIDVAQGLSYMHHDYGQAIVHRDIKSSNILLGPDLRAKIADFGLAMILQNAGVSEPLSNIAGTRGYMAPEYGRRPRVNEKVDVYSFGVVLLELTTGKVALDRGADINMMCLADWARRRRHQDAAGAPAAFEGMIDEAIRDPAFMKGILSVFTLGVTCTRRDPLSRPSMETVLHQLISVRTHSHGSIGGAHTN